MTAYGPCQLAAIERGNVVLRDWVVLLETGTEAQIEMEIWRRGALVRADVIVRRAVDAWRSEEAKVE